MAGTRGGVEREGAARIAGTRGGVGRIAAMVFALAVALLLVLADAARAGTYEVAQCGWGVGSELDRAALAESWGAGVIVDECARTRVDAGAGLRLVASPLLVIGEGLKARWLAPPGTGIVGLRGVWAGDMWPDYRQDLGFEAEDGGAFQALTAATAPFLPAPVSISPPAPAAAVELRLACLGADLEGCRSPTAAWTLLREVTITLADAASPRARVAGPLLAPGWHRGRVALELGGDDGGAGIERLEAEVGGGAVAVAPQPCSAASIEGAWRATAMRPCQRDAAATVEVETVGLPDGVDSLRGCAVDFAGNIGCSADAEVGVDNSPPTVAFAATQPGRVAASAFDPYSGPASGTLAFRRADSEDWAELPTEFHPDGPGKATLVASLPAMKEGDYVFRAQAADALGNGAEASMRIAGSPAAIKGEVAAAGQAGVSATGAPGGRRTRLRVRLLGGGGGRTGARGRSGGSSPTLPFGAAAMLVGQLTDGDGAPVAGETVRVSTRPSSGAVAPAPREVTTDAHGRFAVHLQAGPSRHLVASFPGGDGLAPSRSRPLALRVRAAITLAATPRVLRTGQTVHLLGRVGHRGARIPGRGKLIAIQYLERDSGRWRPALVVRTGGAGRFHADYRFRYVSGVARIRLRATALPEADWPYASGSSAPVTVRVHGG